MKVNGIPVVSLRIVKVYLPVNDEDAVEFRFRPLRSDENFAEVMARPIAPEVIKPGGVKIRNLEEPGFRKAVEEWAGKKVEWEFLKSISATEGLEWDTVDMADPNTWGNWQKDIEKTFGSSPANLLFNSFMEAQYITEEVMEKARARFLTGRPEQPA